MLARSVFILLASTALAACGDPTAPAMRRLAGTYEASRNAATSSAERSCGSRHRRAPS
jgi:hypothetical protein